MRSTLVPAALFALSLAATSCTPVTPSTPTLTGSWEAPSPSDGETTLVINPDQTFEMDYGSDQTPEIFGTYKVAGEEITFANSATDGSVPLDPRPGKYRFSLGPGSIAFTPMEDQLSARAEQLAKPWRKVE